MLASESAVAGDRPSVHLAKSPGLANAASLGDMLQDRLDLGRREPGIEEWRPLAFGEAAFAGAAAKHASGLLGAIAGGDREVFRIPLPVIRTSRTQAAEA